MTQSKKILAKVNLQSDSGNIIKVALNTDNRLSRLIKYLGKQYEFIVQRDGIHHYHELQLGDIERDVITDGPEKQEWQLKFKMSNEGEMNCNMYTVKAFPSEFVEYMGRTFQLSMYVPLTCKATYQQIHIERMT